VQASLGRQLAAQLEERILSGGWAAGTRLPGERDLATEFGVSRSTVREALEALERSGLVVRHQGRGTHVAPRRLEQELLGHFSIVDGLRANGVLVTNRILTRRPTPASPVVARELALPAGTTVLELERIRIADGRPFMLEHTWLPLTRLPGLDTVDLRVRRLYDVLREDHGVELHRADEAFEPVILTSVEAGRLDQSPGDAALLLLRTTFDAADVPVETARAILRGDMVRPLVQRRVYERVRP
jgi:GntR family transcriptional regulator